MPTASYPEPSPGPRYRARCCGSTLQSLHRYHIERCSCGRVAVDGGAEVPRLICHQGEPAEWLEPAGVE
jgi:hypothetical protein